MSPRDNIEKTIKQFDVAINTKRDEQVLKKLRSTMSTSTPSQPETRHEIWRMIMQNKTIPLASAATILVVVLLSVLFIAGPGTTGIAFADVLERIQSMGYTFDLTTYADEQSFQTARGMVLEPGKIRIDATVGLGKISTIIDTREDKSMILFHQFKTAQIQEMPTMAKDYGAEGILFLCSQSIINLWGMQDGTEESLGEKVIDGHQTTGFKVQQKGPYFQSNTTIWADCQTAVPVLVEITLSALNDGPETTAFTMSHFNLDATLDEALFSIRPPDGYTLAHQNSIDELANKNEPSNPAQTIVQALDVWAQDDKAKAIDLLFTIDWTQPIEFSGKPYLFSLTEKEYISLKPSDQQTVTKDVMSAASNIKKITRELLSRGKAAMEAQKHEEAKRCFQTAYQLGNLLTRDPEAVLIGRLVGISVEQMALNELIPLYSQTNQQEKLVLAQQQLKASNDDAKAIKNKAGGL